jgi:hypothetical protein
MARPRDVSTTARESVLRTLAEAHDRFAEQEQVLVAEGRYAESQGAHQYGLWVLRAYKCELDDHTPPGLEHPHHTPIPGCPRCES